MEKLLYRKKLYLILQIALIIIASIVFLYMGSFVHEFFHLIILVYFGIQEVEYYVSFDGSGYVKYIWTDELTVEEKLIVTMAGSLFTLILFLLIMIYFYSKIKKLTIIPIPRILLEISYWYSGGIDRQKYIKYNPTIDFIYVNNLFLGLIILVYVLTFVLIMVAVFSICNEIRNI